MIAELRTAPAFPSSQNARCSRDMRVTACLDLPMKRLCHALLALLICAAPAFAELSDAELDKVGRKVWQNESGGKRDGLTAWNVGENFPSLGIGHFIWYPKGVNGPFEESFPKLIEFFQ